jgi:hypothetical protein
MKFAQSESERDGHPELHEEIEHAHPMCTGIPQRVEVVDNDPPQTCLRHATSLTE